MCSSFWWTKLVCLSCLSQWSWWGYALPLSKTNKQVMSTKTKPCFANEHLACEYSRLMSGASWGPKEKRQRFKPKNSILITSTCPELTHCFWMVRRNLRSEGKAITILFSLVLKHRKSMHFRNVIKPWPNRSWHKFWTCVRFVFCLATHLRWLALTLVELKFGSK